MVCSKGTIAVSYAYIEIVFDSASLKAAKREKLAEKRRKRQRKLAREGRGGGRAIVRQNNNELRDKSDSARVESQRDHGEDDEMLHHRANHTDQQLTEAVGQFYDVYFTTYIH